MSKKSVKGRYFLFVLFAILVVVSLVIFSTRDHSSRVALGGDINLVDTEGKNFSLIAEDKDLSVVFFGFTRCPSFCPMALQQITEALDLLDEDDADDVNVLFITIDPERDTASVMADYLENFHPAIKGLTGSKGDVKSVLNNYKVFSQKVEEEGDGHQYTMDHSTYIYFVDERGEYLEHLEYDADPEEIKAIINKHL